MLDRFRRLIVRGERAAEIGFGVGVLRTERDSGAKVFDGLRKLIVHGKREAEIVLGIEIARTNFRGDGKMRDGLREILRGEERSAESVFYRCIARAERERTLIVIDRLGNFTASLQHGGEIVVRFKIVGIIFDVMAGDGFL